MRTARALTILAIVGLFPMQVTVAAPPATVSMLGHTYHLGSFNSKSHPMWEFVGPTETVNNWTTLVTVIDRTDARSISDLDRLAEGIMSTYKSSNGRILMAKTMQTSSGSPYNYMVVAFDEPATHRFELNFVKLALGAKNAYIVVYGARITSPHDYLGKSKKFLTQHSGEIGRALENFKQSEIDSLPRKTF